MQSDKMLLVVGKLDQLGLSKELMAALVMLLVMTVAMGYLLRALADVLRVALGAPKKEKEKEKKRSRRR